eukprot:maker-scaffold589_size129586-snap-gene-0.37 protein:Tk07331 transcript:maker-scaffold589_size129586-snap-gene-0.37-mRNA-1 annotation:"loquacious"
MVTADPLDARQPPDLDASLGSTGFMPMGIQGTIVLIVVGAKGWVGGGIAVWSHEDGCGTSVGCISTESVIIGSELVVAAQTESSYLLIRASEVVGGFWTGRVPGACWLDLAASHGPMHSPGNGWNHHMVVTSYALHPPALSQPAQPPLGHSHLHAHHHPHQAGLSPASLAGVTATASVVNSNHSNALVVVSSASDHHLHHHQPQFAAYSNPSAPGAYPYCSNLGRGSGEDQAGLTPILPTFGGVATKALGGIGPLHHHPHQHPPWTGIVNSYPDMSHQYHSNPVGALQERFQSNGFLPQYRVVQADGAPHCPIFSYQVLVGDKVAMGSGSSKKQAKHAAARAMLDKLDGIAPILDGVQPLPPVESIVGQGGTLSKNGSSPASSLVGDAVSIGNTVGKLQELCLRCGLQMPMYELIATEGRPHQRSFKIIVKVGLLSECGEGISRKDAKRVAAGHMIKTVNEYLAESETKPVVKVEGADDTDKDVKDEPTSSPKTTTRDTNGNGASSVAGSVTSNSSSRSGGGEKIIKTLTPKESQEIQHFYAHMKDEPDNQLNRLHKRSLKGEEGDFVKMLNDLSLEQKFEVTYVEIDEPLDDGTTHSLVQLSTLPVAVCMGSGEDQEKAKKQAARSALIYLKMMTMGPVECKTEE